MHDLRMIDVGHKPVSLRTARASARLRAAVQLAASYCRASDPSQVKLNWQPVVRSDPW